MFLGHRNRLALPKHLSPKKILEQVLELGYQRSPLFNLLF